MRKQFRDTVMALSETDDSIALVFGDVSVYLFNEFSRRYPERFFNMGICESTLISAAAGMAAVGLSPIVHTIAPFITERVFEQIKLDLCYNRFVATVISCGASFDYAWDGSTHHTYADLAILSKLPDLNVVQPGSDHELDVLLRTLYRGDRPNYIRLSDHPHSVQIDNIAFGKGCILRNTNAPLTIVTAGPILANVLPACADLDVNLVYYHTIKPFDSDILAPFANSEILVIHDAMGLYEALCLARPGLKVSLHGLPDSFLSYYGTVHDIRAELGFDTASLKTLIEQRRARL